MRSARCAAIDGRCYGLVAPGNATAEVVADRLLGGAAEFPGADLSTKLKLLGVDVASFGDAHATSDGALEVVLNDATKGTYAKLVVSDDASTLLGGILVGDASAYGTLRPLVGQPAARRSRVADLAGRRQIGARRAARRGADLLLQRCEQGRDLRGHRARAPATCPRSSARTAAGTSCGSCVPMLKRLLEAQGVEQSKALCEHFTQSRAELFQIVAATGIRTFSGLIAKLRQRNRLRHLQAGRRLDPRVDLVSEHILDGEARRAAGHQRPLPGQHADATAPTRWCRGCPGGEITPEKLIAIGEVARDFGLYTKITGGQRIDLFGARVEQLPADLEAAHRRRLGVRARLRQGAAHGEVAASARRGAATACRTRWRMAIDLELRYRGLRSPHKIKMGVSGCPRECAEARGKDVGVIATEKGWNLYVGGNGGAPRSTPSCSPATSTPRRWSATSTAT